MNINLLLKAIITTLLVPGSVIFLLPCIMLRHFGVTDWPDISGVTILAMTTGLIGFVLLLHCIWGFATYGKGTLAPIDPPKILVVQGLYRHTRNPMYLAVVLVLLSKALFFGNLSLLMYAFVVLVGFHLFVIFYEEPHLRAHFGESYDDYFKAIPRWTISIRGLPSRNSASDPPD
jgi:protein-S-isoprenylcysteine O-methyltransferase Ste14